eukprot:7353987-Prymnesium_polylepis.2
MLEVSGPSVTGRPSKAFHDRTSHSVLRWRGCHMMEHSVRDGGAIPGGILRDFAGLRRFFA